MTEIDIEPPDEQLVKTLRTRRPAPSRRFGGRLRERLTELESRSNCPARLWTLVAAYASSGALLLLLAALGASGGGPFGS
jgi:hypothetical protein